MSKNVVIFLGFSLLLILLADVTSAVVDYRAALTKSLLFFEAQRSGILPPNQRVQWRANSALHDGSDQKVNLMGGYYDAGDNVKFGFPMAYSITMLAWSVVEFSSHLKAQNELQNALDAIKWGTDYLLRAHTRPNTLYGQVGEGNSDHDCWQRPEDMTTPRTSFYIDEQHPGADLAGETAAALAAASIAFKGSSYSAKLLYHARQLFDFARNHPGVYSKSIPSASTFYSSSGYEDELLWAAAWLHRASFDKQYSDYIYHASNTGGTRSMFSWDDKYVGAQILIAKEVLHGAVPDGIDFREYKNNAEQFICNCVGKGNNNVKRTNGGLLWFGLQWSNLQYINSASFVIAAYADYLSSATTSLHCSGGVVSPTDLINFVKYQVNYILGQNPKGMSYMVGYRTKYPQQVHHRGASIVSIKKDKTFVSCKGGYYLWFNKNAPNPNVLEGAIVGGPDGVDNYSDTRGNYQQAEPATANNAPIVGVLARIASLAAFSTSFA